jgi:hypothetical protein
MALRAVLKTTFAVLTAAFVAAFFAPKAHAFTVPCFQGDGVELFKKEHNEHPIVRGKAKDGAIYYLLVNPETKSWTMVIERPGAGQFFCPVASGIEFTLMPPPPLPVKEKSKKEVDT